MRLPADTYKVPDNPLYVMTALYLEDEGGARVLGGCGNITLPPPTPPEIGGGLVN